MNNKKATITVEEFKNSLIPFMTKETGLRSVKQTVKRIDKNPFIYNTAIVEGQATLLYDIDLPKTYHWEERKQCVEITIDLNKLTIVKISVAQCNKGARKHNAAIKEIAITMHNVVMEQFNKARHETDSSIQDEKQEEPRKEDNRTSLINWEKRTREIEEERQRIQLNTKLEEDIKFHNRFFIWIDSGYTCNHKVIDIPISLTTNINV